MVSLWTVTHKPGHIYTRPMKRTSMFDIHARKWDISIICGGTCHCKKEGKKSLEGNSKAIIKTTPIESQGKSRLRWMTAIHGKGMEACGRCCHRAAIVATNFSRSPASLSRTFLRAGWLYNLIFFGKWMEMSPSFEWGFRYAQFRCLVFDRGELGVRISGYGYTPLSFSPLESFLFLHYIVLIWGWSLFLWRLCSLYRFSFFKFYFHVMD